MKNLSLYFLLLSFMMSAQAPTPIENTTPKTLKYEFGFNLFSLTDLYGAAYFDISTYRDIRDQNFFSGIFVKRHYNKNCLRSSFDLYRKAINIYRVSNGGENFYQNNGNIMTSTFRLGYEREFCTKKLVPYLSADLVYMYTVSKGFVSAAWSGDWSSGSYSNVEYLVKRNEYAISIGSGLKWKLTNNLQLSYEFNAQFGYYNYGDPLSSNSSGNGGTIKRVNPLRQLGLSILF